MDKLEKVINGLECCIKHNPDDKTRCGECPYDGACLNRLKSDALALLKAQEPRVMTLEEIEAGEFDFAYLEYRVDGSDEFIDSIIKPVLIVWTLNNGIGMMHADNADLTEWKDEYKKTFRLWTAMPRPEYRKAAKWE